MSNTTQDYSIERYAEKIIAGKPTDYEGIEVQGVRSYSIGPHQTGYEVDNDDPEAYSVYVRLVEGGVDCVGDFTRLADARAYALELGATYGWSIWDYAKPLSLAA